MIKKCKRPISVILAIALSFCSSIHSPTLAYASPSTPSNASPPGGEDITPEDEAWLKDIPYYYDDNMNKVYDYETFPERYYGVEPAIAGVDDVALLAVVAIGCVLGAFGIHMASEDIGTFLVGSFKPWLEKKHPDKMSDFEIFLTGGAIAISEWVPLLGEFLNGEEVSVKDTGIEYKPAAVPAKPYNCYTIPAASPWTGVTGGKYFELYSNLQTILPATVIIVKQLFWLLAILSCNYARSQNHFHTVLSAPPRIPPPGSSCCRNCFPNE